VVNDRSFVNFLTVQRATARYNGLPLLSGAAVGGLPFK
jgi:hypothetical protein